MKQQTAHTIGWKLLQLQTSQDKTKWPKLLKAKSTINVFVCLYGKLQAAMHTVRTNLKSKPQKSWNNGSFQWLVSSSWKQTQRQLCMKICCHKTMPHQLYIFCVVLSAHHASCYIAGVYKLFHFSNSITFLKCTRNLQCLWCWWVV